MTGLTSQEPPVETKGKFILIPLSVKGTSPFSGELLRRLRIPFVSSPLTHQECKNG